MRLCVPEILSHTFLRELDAATIVGINIPNRLGCLQENGAEFKRFALIVMVFSPKRDSARTGNPVRR